MKMRSLIGGMLCILMLLAVLAGCDSDPQPSVTKNPCADGHAYLEGKCAVCGAKDPDYVAPSTPKTPEEAVSGWYTLTQKTVSGGDVTDNYLYNVLHLNNGKAIWYETDLAGMKTTEAVYTVENDQILLEVGLKVYDFAYDAKAGTLSYTGKVNRKPVTMNFAYDKDFAILGDTGDVAFTDELFGEDLSENFYNYCPTILMEDAKTMHIWYCSNQISGNVTDYIGYRKGTLHSDGKWTFTEKTLVLAPGTEEGDWDHRHVCDPTVVKGQFRYKSEEYSYLMAYLGCRPADCTCNEVGIAVAKSPEGPWIKVEELNPIANYYESDFYDPNGTQFWGYGQPSLINIDKAGKVLLFYSKGLATTITQVELWDFSNLDDPKKLDEAELTNRGIVNASGGSDVINNADFAYDPVAKRIYCLKEDFGYPTDGGVNWITGSNTLFYAELSEDETTIGQTIFGDFDWNRAGAVTPAVTGFARNHNMGIVTDAYGWIMDSTKIPIVYTMSYLVTDFPDWTHGGQWPALHTYRLHGIMLDV